MHRVSLTVGGGSPRKGRWIAGPALLLPLSAHASLLPPHLEEKLADILGIAVLFIVPLLAIAVFWIVHVLPEKIAEKKQHPQKHAIHTLCLLSLVFGGMLWPLAWIWAYTRPVFHRAAYGTDLHEDHFVEVAGKLQEGTLSREDARHAWEELQSMDSRGALPPTLRLLKEEIERKAIYETAAAPAPAAPTAHGDGERPAPAAQSGGGKA
jgi:hypothetical protein